MASSSRRKQALDVNPEQLIKLESSPFVKHTLEGITISSSYGVCQILGVPVFWLTDDENC